MSASEENDFRSEQRIRLESLGECPQWISDADGNDYQVVMLKSSGTVFFLDLDKRDWVFRRDGTTLTQFLSRGKWSTTAPLTDDEVRLPDTIEELPTGYDAPRFGFKPQWRNYLKERAAESAPIVSARREALPGAGGQSPGPSAASVHSRRLERRLSRH